MRIAFVQFVRLRPLFLTLCLVFVLGCSPNDNARLKVVYFGDGYYVVQYQQCGMWWNMHRTLEYTKVWNPLLEHSFDVAMEKAKFIRKIGVRTWEKQEREKYDNITDGPDKQKERVGYVE